MPKLWTNKAREFSMPNPNSTTDMACITTYDEYLKQREHTCNVKMEKIDGLTNDFKKKVSDPVKLISNQTVQMGEHFVIPVKELKEMLNNSGDNPEFIQVFNAMRETIVDDCDSKGNAIKTRIFFPVAILVPFERKVVDGKLKVAPCEQENSVYIETYPCPPDPRCPSLNGIDIKFFPEDFQYNDYKSLT